MVTVRKGSFAYVADLTVLYIVGTDVPRGRDLPTWYAVKKILPAAPLR